MNGCSKESGRGETLYSDEKTNVKRRQQQRHRHRTTSSSNAHGGKKDQNLNDSHESTISDSNSNNKNNSISQSEQQFKQKQRARQPRKQQQKQKQGQKQGRGNQKSALTSTSIKSKTKASDKRHTNNTAKVEEQDGTFSMPINKNIDDNNRNAGSLSDADPGHADHVTNSNSNNKSVQIKKDKKNTQRRACRYKNKCRNPKCKFEHPPITRQGQDQEQDTAPHSKDPADTVATYIPEPVKLNKEEATCAATASAIHASNSNITADSSTSTLTAALRTTPFTKLNKRGKHNSTKIKKGVNVNMTNSNDIHPETVVEMFDSHRQNHNLNLDQEATAIIQEFYLLLRDDNGSSTHTNNNDNTSSVENGNSREKKNGRCLTTREGFNSNSNPKSNPKSKHGGKHNMKSNPRNLRHDRNYHHQQQLLFHNENQPPLTRPQSELQNLDPQQDHSIKHKRGKNLQQQEKQKQERSCERNHRRETGENLQQENRQVDDQNQHIPHQRLKNAHKQKAEKDKLRKRKERGPKLELEREKEEQLKLAAQKCEEERIRKRREEEEEEKMRLEKQRQREERLKREKEAAARQKEKESLRRKQEQERMKREKEEQLKLEQEAVRKQREEDRRRLKEQEERNAREYEKEEATRLKLLSEQKAARLKKAREQQEAARLKKEKEKEKRAENARKLKEERAQFWAKDQEQREEYMAIILDFGAAEIMRQNNLSTLEDLKTANPTILREIEEEGWLAYNKLYSDDEALFNVRVLDSKNKSFHGRSGTIMGWNKSKGKYKVGLETKNKKVEVAMVQPENLEIISNSSATKSQTKNKDQSESVVELISIQTSLGVFETSKAVIEKLRLMSRKEDKTSFQDEIQRQMSMKSQKEEYMECQKKQKQEAEKAQKEMERKMKEMKRRQKEAEQEAYDAPQYNQVATTGHRYKDQHLSTNPIITNMPSDDEQSTHETAMRISSVFETMSRMRELMIANDDVDADDLLKRDKILQDWYVDNKQKKKEWEHDMNPEEFKNEYRKKSHSRRKLVLDKANNHRFEAECMGETHKLENAYLDLLRDMKKYKFAWFGIIFAEKDYLNEAYFALKVLLSLMRLQLASGELVQSAKTLEMCKRASDAFTEFSQSVAKEMWDTTERAKWQERATDSMETEYECQMLEWHHYGSCGDKDKAVEAFEEACFTESTIFHDGMDDDDLNEITGVSCKSILSSFTGKYVDFETMMHMTYEKDSEECWRCISIGISILRSMKRLPSALEMNKGKICSTCGKSEEDAGLELKNCARCKSIYYCSRKCQKNDWKRHKKECKDGFCSLDMYTKLSSNNQGMN